MSLKKIKIFGFTILEIESDDQHSGAPDFTSYPQKAGFINTSVVPDRLLEEPDEY